MQPITVEQSPYKANKQACKELIGELLGAQFGITQDPQQAMPNVNKSLIRSSREALKEVFKDKELGADAFNYLSSLKNEDGKTPQQIVADRAVFEQRATETRDLLSQNTRKTNLKDLYDERVVGKAMKRRVVGGTIGAVAASALVTGVTAGVTAPLIASIATGAATIPNIAFATVLTGAGFRGLAAPVALAADAVNELREKPSVTKIHSGKTVKADSLAEGFKIEANAYENLNLDYKDLLFKTITGKESKSYEKAYEKVRSNIANAVDEVLVVPELRSKTTEPENITKADKRKAILTARLNPEKGQNGIADRISSFLAPTAEEVTESKNAIEKQNSARARLEQERQERSDNPRTR